MRYPRLGGAVATLLVALSAVVLTRWVASAEGGKPTIFGPVTYFRVPGPPQTFEDTFTVDNPSAAVYLFVTNGSPNGTNRLSVVTISINDLQVLSPDDLDEDVRMSVVGLRLPTLQIGDQSTVGANTLLGPPTN